MTLPLDAMKKTTIQVKFNYQIKLIIITDIIIIISHAIGNNVISIIHIVINLQLVYEHHDRVRNEY